MTPSELITAMFRPALFAAGIVAIAAAVILGMGYDANSQTLSRTADNSPAESTHQQDLRWAGAACTNVLDWKNEISADETSLHMSLNPITRIEDAVSQTEALGTKLESIGLPPAARSGPAHEQVAQFGERLRTQLSHVKSATSDLENGNPMAALAAINDISAISGLASGFVGAIQHSASVDLGLAIVETRACRQLFGSPV